MGSLREWQHLSPIEQTLAEWVWSGPTGSGLDTKIDGMLSRDDLAIKGPGLSGSVQLYRVPRGAINAAQRVREAGERQDGSGPGGGAVPYGERA